MIGLSLLDWIALCWFVSCWVIYHHVARYRSKREIRLQNALQLHINRWIEVIDKRDVRIADTNIVANLERNATFLASSSLFIIAALLTVIGSTDNAITFLSGLSFISSHSREAWEIKILCFIIIYVYVFFTFTWCMRQYGFASIMIGGAPLIDDDQASEEQHKSLIESLQRVLCLAVISFNSGLRGYYFSLALLAWFIHPLAFILATAWVVAVLYRREFRSKTVSALTLLGNK
jgi:uncharacterized membrane protein